VNQAHNDLLQVLIETGIAGFSLMVWFLVGLFRTGLARTARWSHDLHSAGALIGLLGCTGILIHSTLDFNMHIPANAAFFYAACALASGRPREPGIARP
jgi:O-antigen ligase